MKPNLLLNNIRRRVDELNKCVNCGLCQAVCPTYITEGYEGKTARGKIELLKGLLNNTIEPSVALADVFDDCLTCYACQSVCPAGVRTERLWTSAREDLAEFASSIMKKRRALNWTIGKQRLFKFYVRNYGLFFGFNPAYPERTKMVRYGLPVFRGAPYLRRLPEVIEPAKKTVGAVGLLIGCSGNLSAPWAVDAAIKLLTSAGLRVIIPKSQGCCGAPAINNGYWSLACRLALKTIDLFESLDIDYITSPDATCTAAMQNDYGEIFYDDDDVMKRWRVLRLKVRQMSGIIAEALNDGRLRFKSDGRRIALHDSCHNTHLGEPGRWREILSALDNIRIAEMPNAALCCGFGGSYAVFHPGTSELIAQKKIADASQTDADTLLVGSPGCQIRLNSVAAQKIQVKLALELLTELCTT